MRYYLNYGYNLRYGELLRLAKYNPLIFLLACLLKLTRAQALVSELPDLSEIRTVALGDMPAHLRRQIDDLVEDGRDHGLSVGFVQRMETAKTSAWLIGLVPRSSRFYVSIALGVGEANGREFTDLRYACISFLDDGGDGIISTASARPYYDPAPFIRRAQVERGGLAAMVRRHEALLEGGGVRVKAITPANVAALHHGYERLTLDWYRQRGLISELKERP